MAAPPMRATEIPWREASSHTSAMASSMAAGFLRNLDLIGELMGVQNASFSSGDWVWC